MLVPLCKILTTENAQFKRDFWISRFLDSIVSEDADIEPRTVATSALAVRRSNHSARSHLQKAQFTRSKIIKLFLVSIAKFQGILGYGAAVRVPDKAWGSCRCRIR